MGYYHQRKRPMNRTRILVAILIFIGLLSPFAVELFCIASWTCSFTTPRVLLYPGLVIMSALATLAPDLPYLILVMILVNVGFYVIVATFIARRVTPDTNGIAHKFPRFLRVTMTAYSLLFLLGLIL